MIEGPKKYTLNIAENHAWVHARDRLCTLAFVLHGLWACRVAW